MDKGGPLMLVSFLSSSPHRPPSSQIDLIHVLLFFPFHTVHGVQEFQKTSTSASLTMLNPLTVWITTNCGKSLGILVNLTCLLRSLYGDKNLQLELDVEQRTKLDREYIVTRLYIVTLLI